MAYATRKTDDMKLSVKSIQELLELRAHCANTGHPSLVEEVQEELKERGYVFVPRDEYLCTCEINKVDPFCKIHGGK